MRTGLKIVGITCAAIAVIGGGMYAAATTFDTTKTDDTRVNRAIDRIVVKADSGDIEFVKGGRNVEIHETKHYVLDSPDVNRTIEHGILTIEAECGGPLSVLCNTDFRIEVPKGVSVDARTYVGDIEIDGVATRRIDARGYVGDIQIDAARKGKIDARTNVGDIAIEVPRDTYDVDSDAEVGDSDVDGLSTSDRARHTIEARSDLGEVDITAAPHKKAR
jgi:DUF4097 and DUF4098 domain-containing protein YvlB